MFTVTIGPVNDSSSRFAQLWTGGGRSNGRSAAYARRDGRRYARSAAAADRAGMRTRAERFDMRAEAYEPIERRWHERVSELDVAVR